MSGELLLVSCWRLVRRRAPLLPRCCCPSRCPPGDEVWGYWYHLPALPSSRGRAGRSAHEPPLFDEAVAASPAPTPTHPTPSSCPPSRAPASVQLVDGLFAPSVDYLLVQQGAGPSDFDHSTQQEQRGALAALLTLRTVQRAVQSGMLAQWPGPRRQEGERRAARLHHIKRGTTSCCMQLE